MKRFLLGLSLLAVAFTLVGCERNDYKVKNPSTEEMNAARARRDEAVAIYKRAGGQWDNMTPKDRQRIIELSNGDEGMAMQGWPALGMMGN